MQKSALQPRHIVDIKSALQPCHNIYTKLMPKSALQPRHLRVTTSPLARYNLATCALQPRQDFEQVSKNRIQPRHILSENRYKRGITLPQNQKNTVKPCH